MEEVIALVRVSTETQLKKGQGIETQKRAIKDYCQENNLKLALDIFVDGGISGKQSYDSEDEDLFKNREGLHAMLKALEKYKKCIVYNTNRLWRNDMAKVYVKRKFIKAKADIISIEQPNYSVYDNDPNEFLINGMMELLDQYDHMNITRKLANGRRTKVIKDKMKGCGKTPLGYKWQHEGVDKPIIVVDEEEAIIVTSIFKKYSELGSIRKVIQWLNKENIKTRKNGEFTPAATKKILNNSFYIGKLVWGKEEIEGNHEPLINKITFGKIQAQLKRNRKGVIIDVK